MPCGWEGNRRSGVALAMRHRLQWFFHLQAHGLDRQMSTPPTLSRGVSPIFLFSYMVSTAIGPTLIDFVLHRTDSFATATDRQAHPRRLYSQKIYADACCSRVRCYWRLVSKSTAMKHTHTQNKNNKNTPTDGRTLDCLLTAKKWEVHANISIDRVTVT